MSNPVMTSSWALRFELPKNKDKGRDWSVSLSATVICDTAERAAEIIREAHSDAVVYAINHKGKDVTYADPMVLGACSFARAEEKCPKNRRGYQRHQANDHGRCAYCAAILLRPDPATQQPGTERTGEPK